MLEGNKEIVSRYYEEVWNQGRLDQVDGLMAPTVAMNGNPLSAETIKNIVRSTRTSFPDLAYTLQGLLAEGDEVAVRWTWRGTHEGEYRGKAATGTQVTYTGMGFWRIADGKIAEHWSTIDQLSLLQQLGMVTQS
ncbi:MAG: hypothetical protein QOF51_1974 [Chloroflexota bacterium]|nr:hypothetical protein [Chloroflexota bacterium]